MKKQKLQASGAPVANYITAQTFEELKDKIDDVGFPCIVKTAFGGYDGKGQVKLDSLEELYEAESLFKHSACIAEAFVPFDKEISVIIQRNAAGESYCLPVAENIHKHHILHESIVPARVDKDVLEKAEEAASKLQIIYISWEH